MGKSKIQLLKEGLSRDVPKSEQDLFVNFDQMLEHISRLIEESQVVHFLISDWYDIAVSGDKFKVLEKGEKCTICEFYKDNVCTCKVILPTDKMYRIGQNNQYIEIVEGIDYSEDKYFGDYYRVN